MTLATGSFSDSIQSASFVLFKALCGLCPGYLRDSLLLYNPTCILRSSEGDLLTGLPPAEVRGGGAPLAKFPPLEITNSSLFGVLSVGS